MSGDEPPLKRARCSRIATAIYSFIDASDRGFGSTFQIGNKVFFQYGQWPDRILETMSSNWRELANLVESLEVEVQECDLKDCKMFYLPTTLRPRRTAGKARRSSSRCLTSCFG
jgi:hypothetical protein